MKIHTYLSSSGKDLIMEYINALAIEEQVDGLAVLAYMEKGEFEKVLSKRWDKKVYEVYFRRKNCVGGSNMAFAEINIQEIIQEKKNNSEEFYNTWKKSEDEYRLIAEMIELRKQKGISQTQLARTIGNRQQVISRIDVNESTISRFLSGKTEKLSEESVIRIARVFNVSTDFILGTTVIPDKKNYDISELGLSVEAAKNLYTGKVNNDVVNRLLENPRFAMVTYMIAQYMDDTLARGYAAQNQMFATVGSLLLGQNQAPEAVQAARTANAMKIPAYQADQTTIQNTFMTVVKEIKKEAGSDLVAAKAISKEATEKMFAELTKGQDMQNPTITPEAVVDAITGSISGVDGVNQEALDNFNKALLGLMQTMVLPEDDGQDN